MATAGPSSGSSAIQFITSKKGKTVLLHAGHRYNFVKKNKNGFTNWRCYLKTECNTSITLNLQNQIVKEAKHYCMPDMIRNKVDLVMDKCKKQVCSSMEPVPKIFENFMEHGNHNLRAVDIPTYEAVKGVLYKARKDYLHVNSLRFNSLQELRLPEELVKDFFLYDDGPGDDGLDEKIIIFGKPSAKQYLKKFDKFYGDGTFKVVPRLFYQLYSLHVDISQNKDTVNFVPLIYILLSNKSQNTYERLFKILKDQFTVHINYYKCDYEIATINAIKNIFPDVKVSGCYYHFSNAVWKKSKELGFDNVVANIGDVEVNMTLLYIQLALLPPNMIPEGYLDLSHLLTGNEVFDKFNKYFTNQWIRIITCHTFSCYKEKFRTTNAIEGWHRRINARIPPKPSIFFFIQLLKKEGSFQEQKLLKSEIYSKEKRRASAVIKKDIQITNIINGVLNEEFTILECLRRLVLVVANS